MVFFRKRTSVPEELGCLKSLEAVLIDKRLLFKKIDIIPKEKTPKIHQSMLAKSVASYHVK